MHRLQAELQRLFGAADARHAKDDETRAAVLGVGRPEGWSALSAVWRGVQAELALPAPAIAVDGTDAVQLWFALAMPRPVAQVRSFLEGLRRRYLADVPMARVSLEAGLPAFATEALPPTAVGPERWSAFLAPDLVPMFADEPWLDMPPSPDGQAELLARLQGIAPIDFDRVCRELEAAAPAVVAGPAAVASPAGAQGPRTDDPRAFLLAVMNDASAPLHLRIEAAKALLPGSDH